MKICKNGHAFDKSSSCPVCPICSSVEMGEKYGEEFPRIGAPAFRAIDSIGITRLTQLIKHSEQELFVLHGLGPKAIKLLRERLTEKGYHLLINKY
ncbi:hypothetical protein A2397_03570 [Candidatus Amesbacteria bacterium RIFOXYB1_FULL_44_23]|uniref:RNA polymerase alpha subunit C-terminal domain-containing protein n=1 Tax=Candidatus Amesbacteria bacterium RIFOXYB1_FULL_44_23 TaxID=1797263 RepID=A0A1F4ZPG2_9BACT|nr:MAG: hypothetical protein A2397_03570 [Candidatus Amesbacteria bacterium RIFOXYB1_FULL_44_23]